MTFEEWTNGEGRVIAAPHVQEMLRNTWQAAYRQGKKEGQEGMRERACNGIEGAQEGFGINSQWAEGYAEALGDVLKGIRALEIKEGE